MPTMFFTEDNDSYSVTTSDTYALVFLSGDDFLRVNIGIVEASMGEDNDVVDLRGGTSTIYGDSGNDRFELYVGATIYGGRDNDVFNLRAAAADLLLRGGDGHDNFFGRDYGSTGEVRGDGGDDLFAGFRSGVTLYGGTGNDLYRVNPVSSATFVELAGEGTDGVQLMQGADYTLPANIENVTVGAYAGSDTTRNPTITLNGLHNLFTGHDNGEAVSGLGGNDRLFGRGATTRSTAAMVMTG